MKFEGNLYSDLGISYFFTEDRKDVKTGKVIERHLVDYPLTEEEVDRLSRYDNIRVIKGGATYRYAPEQKYDVVDIFVEDTPEAEESYDEAIGIDEPEILDRLDKEIGGVDGIAQLSGLISQLDSLVITTNSLSEMFFGSSEIFKEFAGCLSNYIKEFQDLKSGILDKTISDYGDPDTLEEDLDGDGKIESSEEAISEEGDLENAQIPYNVDLEEGEEDHIRRLASKYNLACYGELEVNRWGGPCRYGLEVEGKAKDIFKFLKYGLKQDVSQDSFYEMVKDYLDSLNETVE